MAAFVIFARLHRSTARVHYVRARRALLWMLALGLVTYWAWPMAPPRFAIPRIVDIVAAHDLFGADLSPSESRGNGYSAMPSMHTALALWCAYAAFSPLRARHPRVAWLVWLFPAGMIAVVIATGNHYVLGVVGSALLLSVARFLANPPGTGFGGRRGHRPPGSFCAPGACLRGSVHVRADQRDAGELAGFGRRVSGPRVVELPAGLAGLES